MVPVRQRARSWPKVGRLDVSGANLSLMDYCTAGPQFASGGFSADSRLPFVINGSQQQWLTRNSEIAGWSNGVWNAVFSGVAGAPPEDGFPAPPYTTLDQTPVSREKPYLFVDESGEYAVRVPAARRDSRGISWAAGETPGRTIPLARFVVARPGDPVSEINQQLARGRHLLLTPGVVIAGVTVDAGTIESPYLMRVGTRNGNRGHDDARNPTTLSDVYFRVGGPHVGKADVSLEVNSDHVLIDPSRCTSRTTRCPSRHRPQGAGTIRTGPSSGGRG